MILTTAVMVKDINGTAYDFSPQNFVEMGGCVYFGADDGVNGRELWKSDGTPEGTVMVKEGRSERGSFRVRSSGSAAEEDAGVTR